MIKSSTFFARRVTRNPIMDASYDRQLLTLTETRTCWRGPISPPHPPLIIVGNHPRRRGISNIIKNFDRETILVRGESGFNL